MAIHKVDGVDGDNNFPKKYVRLYAAAIVTKGDWVRIDLDNSENGLGASVEQAPAATAGGDCMVLGVATETVAAGSYVKVQTAGLYGDNTTGGGAAVLGSAVTAGGKALVVDDTGAAGQADIFAGATHVLTGPCGISISAGGAGDYGTNEATVMIIDQGYF